MATFESTTSATTSFSSKVGKRPLKNANPRLKVSLKGGALQREDVMCPICLSMLFEPVTFPCTHSLCLPCYKTHVQETSLSCPICRMRLSVWSRRAFKENSLLDKDLWERIQKEFPRVVEVRRSGEGSQNLNPEDLVSVLDQSGIGKSVKLCKKLNQPAQRDPLSFRPRGSLKRPARFLAD